MNATARYRPRPGEIPTQPGVYRFQDATHRVLYVGKARNLRSRLGSYFVPRDSLHERTRNMVDLATTVDWTVVANEFEALQLEFTWIKEFDPPFNVHLKDDKSYPYLAVTLKESVPRVMLTRNRSISGARYFGPFPKAWAIRKSLDLLLKAFPMRSCTSAVYARAHRTGRPCLLGDIGLCAAPCVARVSLDEHRTIVNDLVSFMAGNDTAYVAAFTRQMKAASHARDYEAAARYRDNRDALKAVLEKTSIVLPDSVDADVFGIAEDELAASVQMFSVRGGRVRGVQGWVVDKEIHVQTGELVENVVHNAYDSQFLPPREILVPTLPDDVRNLERWLSERREHPNAGRESSRVTLRIAQRGDKAALAQTVATNAANALGLYKLRRTSDYVARSNALVEIKTALEMDAAPLRIECFDVSHLGGKAIVASMVVFEDGLPRNDHYRRFSIPQATDDTDSIYQVVARRLSHLSNADELRRHTTSTPARPKFSYPPNLVIVDGGQPQVEAARRALAESGVENIQLCGISKRLEELWLPGATYPVIVPRNSDALFLVQRIRDEAHRFAINYQRSKRARGITTALEEIDGLGPTRIARLLKHFGSVAQLKRASVDAIEAVPGIGTRLAATVHRHLRAGER